MTATEYVVLVTPEDQEIGLAEKLEAHQKNLLHRAFSVFIFRTNNKLELLLQQRALHKYHSPGLWTNSCCSHPRAGESVLAAGKRRLHEELGMVAELRDVGSFHYTAHFSNGLSENELDHVLVGEVDESAVIAANPDEVHSYRWVTINELRQEIVETPDAFTPWFSEALEMALKHI